MADRSRSIPRFLVVIAVFIVFFCGFVFFKSGFSKCVTINLLMCLTSKNYVGKDGTYFFRYPRDFPIATADWASLEARNIASSNETPPGPIKYEDVNFSKAYYRNAGGDRLGYLLVEKNDLIGVDDYIAQEIGIFNNLSDEWKDEFQIKKPEFNELTIGGERAVELYIVQGPHSFNQPESKYVFFHNGRMYTLSLTYNAYYHKLPEEHYIEAKELILSTFKFTD